MVDIIKDSNETKVSKVIKKVVAPTEPKELKDFDDAVNEYVLLHRKDMTADVIKKMKTLPVVIEYKKSNKGFEFIICKIHISPLYESGIVEAKDKKALDKIDFDLIFAENNVPESNKLIINVPVRILTGKNNDGVDYTRMDVFFSHSVHRSLFFNYRLLKMLEIKGVILDTEPDFMDAATYAVKWE